MKHPDNPVFCAIDTANVADAAALAGALSGAVGGLKLGMEFFYRHGAAGYRAVAQAGLPVFLDLKLHDIPNTVAAGVRSLLVLEPAIVNVHAAGGPVMMRAAKEAAQAGGEKAPLVIAVTVLTSLDDADIAAAGVSSGTAEQALRLAVLAREAGLDGVVCSAHDIQRVRHECGDGFKLVVPGLRPAGSAHGDQKRVMTPREAHRLGADILVIGRPITQARDPVRAARDIAADLERAS